MSLRSASSRLSRVLLSRTSNAGRTFASSSAARDHFLDATPEQFKTAISGSKVAIVDFTASWCPPCKVLGPIIKSVIPADSARAHLVTVDVDEQAELAAQYKIKAMPTVIAMRDGKEIGRFVGLRREDGVNAFLDEVKA